MQNRVKSKSIKVSLVLVSLLFASSLMRVSAQQAPTEPSPTPTVTITPTEEESTQPQEDILKVSGQKWNDLNGDGVWDQGEPAMPGVTICGVVTEVGHPHYGMPMCTVTDQNGAYVMHDLEEGVDCDIYEIVPPGWMQTYPKENDGKCSIVDPVLGNEYYCDFGNYEMPEPDLAIYKSNGVGQVIPGEEYTYEVIARNEGLGYAYGLEVYDVLEADSHLEFVSATKGGYILSQTATQTVIAFPIIAEMYPGEEFVAEVTVRVPAELRGSGICEVTNYADVVDDPFGPNPETNMNNNWEMDTDEVIGCEDEILKVSGQKWNDLNGDGIWDEGEPVMPGVTICGVVTEVGHPHYGMPMCTVTDENGAYVMHDLEEGVDCDIYEIVPEGWTQTYPVENEGVCSIVDPILGNEYYCDFGNHQNEGQGEQEETEPSPTATQTPTPTLTPTPVDEGEVIGIITTATPTPTLTVTPTEEEQEGSVLGIGTSITPTKSNSSNNGGAGGSVLGASTDLSQTGATVYLALVTGLSSLVLVVLVNQNELKKLVKKVLD